MSACATPPLYTARVKYTRRDLSALLPLLAAQTASAQTTALPSKVYSFDELPVKKNGANSSRGLAPHPPHHHGHDEMVILRQGTLAVTIAGKTTNAGPGSVIFFSSGEEHGMKNVGSENAMYYVIALGKD